MKTIILALFTVLFIQPCFSTKITAIANTGTGWDVSDNWDLNRIPVNLDTVIIPASVQMNVKGTIYGLPYPNMVVSILGTLYFDPSGKLDLGLNSKVIIDNSGQINSTGLPSELIRIGGVVKYNGSIDGLLGGPTYADRFTLASPLGFSLFLILPVKIEYFTASQIAEKIKLNFKISSDVNAREVQVEKSYDGKDWSLVLNTLYHRNQKEAEVFDHIPHSNNAIYYRLRVYENRTLVAVSNVSTIYAHVNTDQIKINYDQQAGNLKIKFNQSGVPTTHQVMIVSAEGQTLRSSEKSNRSSLNFNLSGYKNGVYFVVISGEGNVSNAYTFLKF